MKNSEYWEQRIANDTWATYNSLEEKNRALLEMYQEASKAISDELYSLSEKIQSATPTLSDMHKYNRLSGLQKNMENIIRGLGEKVESFGKENMMEGFKNTYSNVMTQLGQIGFDDVPQKVMEEMLDRPWQGSNFSERLWKNTQVLASNLNEILVNGLTQGKTTTEMAIQLSNRMNQGFNTSHRLIRTESMHYLNESAFKGYQDAGVEEVELWAAEDERTCSECGAMHGKKYKIDKRPILPIHANCRCTYLPVINPETLPQNDILVNKSLSAAAKKIYVKNPIGDIKGTDFSIKQGTYIENVNVIAGKGVRRNIDDINRLVDSYKKENGEKTSPKDWQKVVGTAMIDINNGKKAEVHWYQCRDIGKVEFKIKRWL